MSRGSPRRANETAFVAPPQKHSPMKVLVAIMGFGFVLISVLSFFTEDFHHRKEYDHDTAVKDYNRRQSSVKLQEAIIRANEKEREQELSEKERRRKNNLLRAAAALRSPPTTMSSSKKGRGNNKKKQKNLEDNVNNPPDPVDGDNNHHAIEEVHDANNDKNRDRDLEKPRVHEHEHEEGSGHRKDIAEREVQNRNREAIEKIEHEAEAAKKKKNKNNKKVWEEYSFSNSKDKAELHPENNNNNNNNNKAGSSSTIHGDSTTAKNSPSFKHLTANRNGRKYLFNLDRPRAQDEDDFIHKPKSAGGTLNKPPMKEIFAKMGNEYPPQWTDQTFDCAHALHRMFEMYDHNETAADALAVHGTMCIGKDCEFIPAMIKNLDVALGHFLVVLSSDLQIWVDLFSALMRQFPGRFTVFHRPEKLSCAESWNLVTRIGFAHVDPMPEQIFIANADWHPIPSGNVKRNMARFMEWSSRNLDKVLNRYYHFSSFTFTQKGYRELGYFDEVIYPALAEDVEFHLKAVSKNLGVLGLYDNWSKGSKHIHRASAGEKTVQKRHGSVARFDYVLRKWGIRVPNYRDFAHAHPYKTPFDLPWMAHNNSWYVDPAHRQCAKTGDGEKFANSNRCWYNASVLLNILKEKDPTKGSEYDLPNRLTTKKDSFPGAWH